MKEYEKFHRRITAPSKINENRDNKAKQSFHQFYRREAFAVLDQLITDSKENWSQVFEKIRLSSILLPPWDKANEEVAEKFCKLTYGAVGIISLIAELGVLRDEQIGENALKHMPVKDIIRFFQITRGIFPACDVTYTFLLTSSVTVASNERSFSKLKQVKTKLRSTILPDRLESLMIVACENDQAEKSDLRTVVNSGKDKGRACHAHHDHKFSKIIFFCADNG